MTSGTEQRSTHYLAFDDAATIADVFALRCRSSPNAPAYREFDAAAKEWKTYSWREMGERVARARAGLRNEGFAPGDRIAIMLKNSSSWVVADQAAYAQGLVVVPLFFDDRAENVLYLLNDAQVKLLVIEGEEHWKRLKPLREQFQTLQTILTLKPVNDPDEPRLRAFQDWLPDVQPTEPGVLERAPISGNDLATIVYTSGTTGKPKGVMLTHRNMLSNVQSALAAFQIYADDLFLSFLPLSHMFERTCDYYLNVASGACIAFCRSVPQLAEDFRIVQPTIIFSVPRIYERFYAAIQEQLGKSGALKQWLFRFAVDTGWARFEHRQGRGPWKPAMLLWPLLETLVAKKLLARFGGHMRLAISGGAALSPDVAKVFVGLGLPICQGYGLSEASPLLTVNLLEKNDPATIGPAVPGVELKLGEMNALMARGPNIMRGYWNNPQATSAVLSEDGWLNTGDQAAIDANGFVRITGRLKEIIVMGNGEKIPPVDMELAIQLDPLFEQVLVLGEGRPFLVALVVLNDAEWVRQTAAQGLPANPDDDKVQKFLLGRIAKCIQSFPGYAQIRKLAVSPEKWTVENDLMTSTLKLRRAAIVQRNLNRIEDIYKGH